MVAWDDGSMKFLLRVIVNALALWVATWLLPGMEVIPSGTVADTGDPTLNLVIAYLVIGLVFGAVNAVVKPVISAGAKDTTRGRYLVREFCFRLRNRNEHCERAARAHEPCPQRVAVRQIIKKCRAA